jgi:hypothetical protein
MKKGQVITLLGGRDKAAIALGMVPGAVSNLKTDDRGCIKSRTARDAVLAALVRRHVAATDKALREGLPAPVLTVQEKGKLPRPLEWDEVCALCTIP